MCHLDTNSSVVVHSVSRHVMMVLTIVTNIWPRETNCVTVALSNDICVVTHSVGIGHTIISMKFTLICKGCHAECGDALDQKDVPRVM